MSVALSPQGDNRITLAQFPGVRLTPTSLEISDDVSFNDLERIGEILLAELDASAWKIGGFLHALRRYKQRYPEGVEKLQLKYGTLRNLAYVYGKVPEANRFDELSWSHHRAVAPLQPDAQLLWLEDALRHGWTVAELEHELRAVRRPSSTAIGPATPPLERWFDPERVQRWVEYAKEHDMTVAELVTKATDNYIQAELA